MNIYSLWRENSVHRAAYVDPAVFALEQERIFRRAWLYVGHESEVPREGDYVLRRLGPEEVLLVRREDGGLSLLHNRCAHRGARIVAEPSGNARQLRCPYHAWTYRPDGSLIGVPQPDGYADAGSLTTRAPRCAQWLCSSDRPPSSRRARITSSGPRRRST